MASDVNPKVDSSAWFIRDEDVTEVPAATLELLETYANIPAKDVIPHVLKLRKEAFALYPWPCIGRLRFLRPSLPAYTAYPAILATLKSDSSAALLDVGCCFGQDLRKLVVDGVHPSQLAGLDLEPEFNELGKRLFRDADKLHIEFHARDIFDDDADWEPLRRRFDVIHITSFLHIWNWDDQVKAAQRLVGFLKPKPGSLFVGSGIGSTVGGEGANLEGTGTNYRQSEESFARLWKDVGGITGTKWDVKSCLQRFAPTKIAEGHVGENQNMGVLTFEVQML